MGALAGGKNSGSIAMISDMSVGNAKTGAVCGISADRMNFPSHKERIRIANLVHSMSDYRALAPDQLAEDLFHKRLR
jgi:hypothetical protein